MHGNALENAKDAKDAKENITLATFASFALEVLCSPLREGRGPASVPPRPGRRNPRTAT
jgi:hypothetical protein